MLLNTLLNRQRSWIQKVPFICRSVTAEPFDATPPGNHRKELRVNSLQAFATRKHLQITSHAQPLSTVLLAMYVGIRDLCLGTTEVGCSNKMGIHCARKTWPRILHSTDTIKRLGFLSVPDLRKSRSMRALTSSLFQTGSLRRLPR